MIHHEGIGERLAGFEVPVYRRLAAKTRSSLEASLVNLRTDYLDSVLIHDYDKQVQFEQRGLLRPLTDTDLLTNM